MIIFILSTYYHHEAPRMCMVSKRRFLIECSCKCTKLKPNSNTRGAMTTNKGSAMQGLVHEMNSNGGDDDDANTAPVSVDAVGDDVAYGFVYSNEKSQESRLNAINL